MELKNLPGRGGAEEHWWEKSSKVGVNGVKNTTSNIQRPEGQPGTVWGHGFNKYHTPHTKPNRALWAKAKEDTIAEEKT